MISDLLVSGVQTKKEGYDRFILCHFEGKEVFGDATYLYLDISPSRRIPDRLCSVGDTSGKEGLDCSHFSDFNAKHEALT